MQKLSLVPDMHKAILNFHNPPKLSTLDTCPMLDWDKEPPQSGAKIGCTTGVNPGSEYGEGILRGCLVTFVVGEVIGFQMTNRHAWLMDEVTLLEKLPRLFLCVKRRIM
jgi:hypothetical protein